MKIAIYGDSYGSMVPSNSTLNPKMPWFELLTHYYDVTNYSKGGSSLYYSYKMFLENKHKHDKNIILGSFVARIYSPNLIWPHINTAINDYPNIWKNHGLNQEEINACVLYYKHIYNNIEEHDMRLLIEKELKTKPNSLYMSIPETLFMITTQERKHFGYNSTWKENMNAHMTNESNQTFLESVVKWVETDEFNFDINNYKLPNKQDKYMYYI
jgi:hypothetical protein